MLGLSFTSTAPLETNFLLFTHRPGGCRRFSYENGWVGGNNWVGGSEQGTKEGNERIPVSMVLETGC